jgi:hypothetical protein
MLVVVFLTALGLRASPPPTLHQAVQKDRRVDFTPCARQRLDIGGEVGGAAGTREKAPPAPAGRTRRFPRRGPWFSYSVSFPALSDRTPEAVRRLRRCGGIEPGRDTIQAPIVPCPAYAGFLRDVPSVPNDGTAAAFPQTAGTGFRRAHRAIFHFVGRYRQCVRSAFPPRQVFRQTHTTRPKPEPGADFHLQVHPIHG